MAQGDILKRYLDAGLAFTQMTRERAEAIVQDLVKAGEIRRKEAEGLLEELVERSRKNTDELIAIVRREVAEQIRNLGLEDLAARAGARLGVGPGGVAESETPNAADSTLPVPEPAASAVKAAAAKAAKKAAKKATPSTPAKKAGPAKKAAGAGKSAKKAGGSKKGA
ncbi:MAG TPA: hypothetical protein VF230_17660 [Acidimicrobiales bacterium]